MKRAPDVREPAHELTAIIDSKGIGACGTRDVDRGEDVLVQEKTVLRATHIDVEARDLVAIIDPESRGERGARNINRGEDALVQQKSEERRVGKECRSRWSP